MSIETNEAILELARVLSEAIANNPGIQIDLAAILALLVDADLVVKSLLVDDQDLFSRTFKDVSNNVNANNIGINDLDGRVDALEAAGSGWQYSFAQILSDLLANDGPGSGLDADLLDGKESTSFARLNETNDIPLDPGARAVHVRRNGSTAVVFASGTLGGNREMDIIFRDTAGEIRVRDYSTLTDVVQLLIEPGSLRIDGSEVLHHGNHFHDDALAAGIAPVVFECTSTNPQTFFTLGNTHPFRISGVVRSGSGGITIVDHATSSTSATFDYGNVRFSQSGSALRIEKIASGPNVTFVGQIFYAQ